jgi:hypothetical protein
LAERETQLSNDASTSTLTIQDAIVAQNGLGVASMRKTQGGTQMYCPFCGEITVCKGLGPAKAGLDASQRVYRPDHPDLQWFRRARRCQDCEETFVTAEVDEDFLGELVELRNALAQIKENAEQYSRESAAASKSLDRLSKSLSILKALKAYQEAG